MHHRLSVALCLALAGIVSAACAADFTLPTIDGRRLFQGDAPFSLRGLAYAPTPIGQMPGGLYETYTDVRLIQRDAPLLLAAGANTLRIYAALTTDAAGYGTLGTTAAYVRAASDAGLWIVMGTYIDPATDFGNATVRGRIVDAHVALVRAFRDAPNILMWAPGNEVNAQTTQRTAWYGLLNDIALAIKAEQGGGAGPGWGPYVCGIDGDRNRDGSPGAAAGDALAPAVDIWAVNVFRGASLGTLFAEVASRTDRPFWIAEMGIDSWDQTAGREDQTAQALFAQANWDQLAVHCDVVFGADIGFYSDEWWKSALAGAPATPNVQDYGGFAFGNGPDNFYNEEWSGVVAVSPVPGGIDAIVPKEAYRTIANAWAARCPCLQGETSPLLADFNAGTSNNYAGFSFAFYGGGLPAFQDDGRIALSAGATGASGAADDHALRAAAALPAGSAYTYFGIGITLFADGLQPQGVDLSALTTLSFDIRRETPTSWANWLVRLEDADGAEEYNNQPVALPPLTGSFQRVVLPLAAFTSGPGPAPDLSRLKQIVVTADTTGPTPPAYELDLVLDDLRVFSPSPPISQWVAY